MKSHLLIAFGLIVAIIFVNRGLDALSKPGFGLSELYVLGGFVISGLLIRFGFSQRSSK